MPYITPHDPNSDGTLVPLADNTKVDLDDLFGDPNVEAGRDVTLVGRGFAWVRLRKAPGQNIDPDDRSMDVIVVGAALGFPGCPLTLSPGSRDQKVQYSRWLSTFCTISQDPADLILPLELRAYVRHEAGDQL